MPRTPPRPRETAGLGRVARARASVAHGASAPGEHRSWPVFIWLAESFDLPAAAPARQCLVHAHSPEQAGSSVVRAARGGGVRADAREAREARRPAGEARKASPDPRHVLVVVLTKCRAREIRAPGEKSPPRAREMKFGNFSDRWDLQSSICLRLF